MGCFMKHQFPMSVLAPHAGLPRMGNYLNCSAYRISCHAVLDITACAAFRKESRMKLANPTNLDRKSGGRTPLGPPTLISLWMQQTPVLIPIRHRSFVAEGFGG